MTYKTPNKNAGFSLLELLVAMVISVMIGAACYSILYNMMRSKAEIESRNHRLEILQNTLLLVQNDILHMTPRTPSFQSEKIPSYTLENPQTFTLHRQYWRNPLEHNRSQLARIRYSYIENKLKREVWPVTAPTYATASLSQNMEYGLEDLNFRTYVTPENIASALLLPSGIEASVKVSGIDEVTQLFPVADAP